MKRSIYRIILMVSGLWHALVYFLIPYAKLEGLLKGLGQLAGSLGVGDAYPEKLTGLTAVKMASIFGQDEGLFIIMFTVPFVLGLIITLLNLFCKGKGGYVLTMVFSFFCLVSYGLCVIGLQSYAQLGYSSNAVIYLCLLVSVAQLIVSIIAKAKDAEKKVKVGKKDGSITGVTGSYAGAVIPVKSGDTVTIGRDPSVCNLVVKDEKASRKHCVIAYNGDNGMYAVTDLSSNGVFDKDGGRILEKVAVPMSAGSEIRIGKEGEIFRLG